MSSELPKTPDFTIQEERLQYGAEKKKQRDTARLIWASKPRTWNYVLLPQNIFDELEGSGLSSLIDKCEGNLALLKMRKE